MERGLKIVLCAMGAGMMLIGCVGILFGVPPAVPGPQPVTASLDSEIRFYSVWYAAAGLLLVLASRDIHKWQVVVNVVAVAFGVAGCARLLSWATVGQPHPGQIALLVVELLIPAVIVPWMAAVNPAAELHSD